MIRKNRLTNIAVENVIQFNLVTGNLKHDVWVPEEDVNTGFVLNGNNNNAALTRGNRNR